MAGIIYGDETHSIWGATGNTDTVASMDFQVRGRHPERNEGSATREAAGYAFGFFTAFRMTNGNTQWLRSDADAYALAIGRKRRLIHHLAGEWKLASRIWPRHERIVR